MPPRANTSDQHQSSSSWSLDSILLIAGTTVGAGALALPAVTYEAGFLVSSVSLVLAAIFSISTGLLIAEVVINTLRERQMLWEGEGGGGKDTRNDLSLTSISVSLLKLDNQSKLAIVLPYLLLHYACLCAYCVKGSQVVQGWLHTDFSSGLAAFTLSLGGLCFTLPSKSMDRLNSTLVTLLGLSFVGLLAVAAGGFEAEHLIERFNPPAILSAVPIILLSFVYHNVVPLLVTRVEEPWERGNPRSIQNSIVAGVSIPLVIFLLWEAAVLGSGAISPGSDPLLMLSHQSSSSGLFVDSFTLLAVSTSFIAFVFSLSGFISDAFDIRGGVETKASLYLVTLLPPVIWAMGDPTSFIAALDIGGTYGVMLLFGVLPPLLSYAQRYNQEGDGDRLREGRVQLLGGGKPALYVIGGVSLAVIAHSLLDTLGVT